MQQAKPWHGHLARVPAWHGLPARERCLSVWSGTGILPVDGAKRRLHASTPGAGETPAPRRPSRNLP
ncbi:MAG: hypothetical protein LBK99_22260 [Opitutaceae bacterium]|nr:hypothetical protein [Opitutaceae bacterium]